MKMKYVRKFDGKKYTLTYILFTKKGAKETAKELKKGKVLVRIIKGKDREGYTIYGVYTN